MILVLAAMQSEIEAAKKYLRFIAVSKTPLVELHVCSYAPNKDVGFAVTGIGKVFSAATTQHLIDVWDPDFVIMIGIAGAVSTKLSVGDLVYASSLVQYDMDCKGFDEEYEFGEIPFEKSEIFYPVSSEGLIQKHLRSKNRRGISSVQAKIGTADLFINHENYHIYGDRFHNLGISVVEMEGASVASVCMKNGKPFIVLRCISDLVFTESKIDYSRVEAELSHTLANAVMGIVEEEYNE